jgi:hypothetical protein
MNHRPLDSPDQSQQLSQTGGIKTTANPVLTGGQTERGRHLGPNQAGRTFQVDLKPTLSQLGGGPKPHRHT